MLDAWRIRTRDWLARSEKLLALPEQEFAGWTLDRLVKPATGQAAAARLGLLCGETGAGKTALVRHALRHAAGTARRKPVCATATEWVGWLTELDRDGKSTAAINQADLVVCEDLQRLDDPAGDGDRLAAWLDTARQERIAVIVTSESLPGQIRDLSPRLRNRLHGGIVSSIRPLSADSQQRLIQFWRSQGAIPLDASDTAFDPAITTAGRLQSWLIEPASPGNTQDEVRPDHVGILSLELVAELVASDFQVPVAELCSGSRSKGMHTPRQVAMALARELTDQSLTQIGRHFGGRSHTSVVRSCTRLQELLPEAPSLRQQVQLLRAKLRRQSSADCG